MEQKTQGIWTFYYASQVLNFLQIEGENPPPAKRLQLALLQYSLYYGGLEPNLQYLQGMPVIFCFL